MGLLHKQLGRVIMPKTTTLYDPKPERKGHSRIRAQHCSFIIISIFIHLLTPSPHVSLPHGTNVEIEHLEVKTSDVQNAYLTALCAEVIHTTLGTEFGEDEGKTAIIVWALYGLASVGASFRNHLADCMRHLGYSQTQTYGTGQW